MATASGPLLDLRTFVERETIRVDGTLYEIRGRDELSILAQQRLAVRSRRIGEILAHIEDATDADETELHRLLTHVCGLIVDAPPDVLDRLTPANRLQICEVFLPLLLRARRPGTGAESPALTGENSSPALFASTAEARATGSTDSTSRS